MPTTNHFLIGEKNDGRHLPQLTSTKVKSISNWKFIFSNHAAISKPVELLAYEAKYQTFTYYTYSCNKITTTQIQISRQSWNGWPWFPENSWYANTFAKECNTFCISKIKKFVPLQLSKFDFFSYQTFNSVLRTTKPEP